MQNDGISLQTTISQAGAVAKTQLKGQQATQAGTPVAQQLEEGEGQKLKRVGETEKAENRRVESDEEKRKQQEQERQRRRRALAEAGQAESRAALEDIPQDTLDDTPGLLIDTRV